MSTLHILVLSLAFVVAGNLLAVIVRKRHPMLADRLVRYLPLMAAAASSKDREAAIARLIEEVIRLESIDAVPAKIAAADVAGAPKPSSASKVPPMPVLVVCVLALVGGSGCTAQQRLEAKTVGAPIAKIAGAVCEQVASTVDDPWAYFSCSIVKAGASVLDNLSADGRVTIEREEGPRVVFTVRVAKEGAEQFALDHRGDR